MKSEELTAPRRDTHLPGLPVRPDVLTTHFAARVLEVEPDRAVLVLKAASEILLRRMREVHPSATMRMLAFDIGREGAKARDDLHTRVEAAVDLPLSPEADWWTRAQLAAAVTVLSRTLAAEARKQKPVIEIVAQQPVALMREPERHRAEVLRRWVERARELSALAESERAPLHLVRCEPPGDVVQTPVSLEEVRLSIPLEGLLDALR